MNKDFNKKLSMMLALQYCHEQDKKLQEDVQKMQDNLNEFMLNKQAEDEKIEMMIEHPEWFINSSPREFGMKRKSKKFKRKY